jgi:NAD(P)-dependent dehydrogenase (short-subunit alcohol dehydrogenase family)
MASRTEVRSVLVTGAAGNIGLAAARIFAANRVRVFVNDMRRTDVNRAVKLLSAESEAEIIAVRGDIANPGDVAEMFRVVEAHGGIDALINCAADLGIGGTALELTSKRLLRTLEVNVAGTFQCCQSAARSWRHGKSGGVIVNVSSAVARRAIRGRAGYVASKGALDALTRALAVEWAPLGIRVCGIAPAYVATDRWEKITPAVRRRRRANIPTGRESTTAEVAEVIRFLCSPGGAGFCGETLLLDGGTTAQLTPMDADQ